jgi:hypothetical protein
VDAPKTKKSVKVYANTAGNRTFEVLDSAGNPVATKAANLPQGESRVALDISLQAGNYFIKVASGSTVDLYRNNAGASYPYALTNLMSIDRSSAGNGELTYFYFFYDWEVQGSVCRTARTPVPVHFKATGCGTGIADAGRRAGFSVYPEFNDGIVFVNQLREAEMEVLNLSGEVLRKVKLHPGVNKVDLRSLRDGVYLLRQPASPHLTRRIVKGK